MTPTTTLATIAYHDFQSTPPTATKIASDTRLASTHGRDPRTVEVLVWLTKRLDWEDHLHHLNQAQAEDRDADTARG